MRDCDLLATCVFFNDNMPDMPNTSAQVKEAYCWGNYRACARYRVAVEVGRERVPKDLFPEEGDRADAVLSGGDGI